MIFGTFKDIYGILSSQEIQVLAGLTIQAMKNWNILTIFKEKKINLLLTLTLKNDSKKNSWFLCKLLKRPKFEKWQTFS